MPSAKWTARFSESKGGGWCNPRLLSIEVTVVVTVNAPAHVDLKDIESERPVTVLWVHDGLHSEVSWDGPFQATADVVYRCGERRNEAAKNKHTAA